MTTLLQNSVIHTVIGEKTLGILFIGCYTFADAPITLAGDGRFDSPGHSARYCSYTFIDTVRHLSNTIQAMCKFEPANNS